MLNAPPIWPSALRHWCKRNDHVQCLTTNWYHLEWTYRRRSRSKRYFHAQGLADCWIRHQKSLPRQNHYLFSVSVTCVNVWGRNVAMENPYLLTSRSGADTNIKKIKKLILVIFAFWFGSFFAINTGLCSDIRDANVITRESDCIPQSISEKFHNMRSVAEVVNLKEKSCQDILLTYYQGVERGKPVDNTTRKCSSQKHF